MKTHDLGLLHQVKFTVTEEVHASVLNNPYCCTVHVEIPIRNVSPGPVALKVWCMRQSQIKSNAESHWP